jgi:hypothetical protein
MPEYLDQCVLIQLFDRSADFHSPVHSFFSKILIGIRKRLYLLGSIKYDK